MKKVELMRDTETGYDSEQRVIRKLKFIQFEKVMNVIVEIYQITQQDPALQELFAEVFRGEEPVDEIALAKFSEEEKAQIKADQKEAAEKRFMSGLMGSFRILAVHLPVQAKTLLSALSNIEEETLEQQELETFMDVYDAVVEVNNIEELLERVKKSFSKTKKAMAFLKLRRQATTDTPLQ